MKLLLIDILDDLLSDSNDIETYYEAVGTDSDEITVWRSLRGECHSEASFTLDWQRVLCSSL